MNKANTPIQIGSKIVRNRITYAPTVKFGWTDTSGKPHERFARHYEDRAAGGAGLVVVEATCIDPVGRLAPSQLGLWDDNQIDGHRSIAKACHRHGAVVLVQSHYAGYSNHPECGVPEGPSAVEWNMRQTKVLTREMSRGEIQSIRDEFIQAALRAQKAGYDGVQLHACHGYLINQFVSPLYNLRADAYGGSPENRARFGCEIIRGIHQACGDDFVVSARTTGAEPTLGDAWAVADAYMDAGVDYLQVSKGIGPEQIDYPDGLPYNSIVWMGAQMHAHVGGRVPVSAVNGIFEPELVHLLINEGLVDTIDAARALLADPSWARGVLEGADYVRCRQCRVCLWSPFMAHRCPAVAERHKQDPDCVDYAGE